MKTLPLIRIIILLSLFVSAESIIVNTTANDDFDIATALQGEMEDSVSQITYLITGGQRDPEILNKYLPYMVSIRSRNPQKYFGDNHYCSGTIIQKDVVLTAAHCIMDKRRVVFSERNLLLVAGTPNRLEISNTTVQYPVEYVNPNKNFIRRNQNDIAIIHLKRTIPNDNENIKMFQLPTGPPPYGETCTILGWGRLLHYGPLPAKATHLNVLLLNDSDCRQKLKQRFKIGMLCAGHVSENKEDPCRGDSGGPLICNETLTGIISWPISCGQHHTPSLYTSVWYHRKWIDQQLNMGNNRIALLHIWLICFSIVFILTIT